MAFVFYLEQIQTMFCFYQCAYIVREWFILFVSVPFFLLNVNKDLTVTIHAVKLTGQKVLYRGSDKSLARPTSRCILFDG